MRVLKVNWIPPGVTVRALRSLPENVLMGLLNTAPGPGKARIRVYNLQSFVLLGKGSGDC